MSSVSQKLEALAETHCVNVLVIQEWYLERLSIMQSDNIPDAERLALADIERELTGGRDAR